MVCPMSVTPILMGTAFPMLATQTSMEMGCPTSAMLILRLNSLIQMPSTGIRGWWQWSLVLVRLDEWSLVDAINRALSAGGAYSPRPLNPSRKNLSHHFFQMKAAFVLHWIGD